MLSRNKFYLNIYHSKTSATVEYIRQSDNYIGFLFLVLFVFFPLFLSILIILEKKKEKKDGELRGGNPHPQECRS